MCLSSPDYWTAKKSSQPKNLPWIDNESEKDSTVCVRELEKPDPNNSLIKFWLKPMVATAYVVSKQTILFIRSILKIIIYN